MVTGLESLAVALACVLIGFGMGREWERVIAPVDDCPFGDDCMTCHARTIYYNHNSGVSCWTTNAPQGRVHIKTWMTMAP